MNAQASLPLAKRGPKSLTSVGRSHDENNLRSAREILAHLDDYGGTDGAMADWARKVIERLEGVR